MSEDQGDDNKQYEASQKKLDDARKKGEVPKSVDLTTAAAYAGLLIAALGFGADALIGVSDAFMILLDQSDALARVTFAGSPTPIMGGVLLETVQHLLPIFLIPGVLALLAVIVQRAFVVAPSKLKFKGSRISPIQGFKNKFGRSGLFEFFKSFTKLLVFCAVLGVFLWLQMDRIIGAVYLAPGLITTELLRLVIGMMFIVLLISATIGGVDFLFQRAEHMRKHRMSRKELMDEMKQSDGDPMMKQQRRQKAIDIAMNSMLKDVPTADVVVVNPTHYAVALKWDRMPGSAPSCVAKGVDEVAARIREIASENDVPIHSDPPTARALHATVELGQEIDQVHYEAVAAAIRFAEAMRRKAGGTR